MRVPLDIRGRRTSEDNRIRVGFIGCGSHSFRNIYPTFRFAGIDLIATCDLNRDLAETFAKQFGAERHYSNHLDMLEKEELEAVFIVTNYDENGRPRYPRLAIDCMNAGCHAWIEKPPAASVAELEEALELSRRTGRFAMVGFKKCFFPAIVRAKEITQTPEFGGATTIAARYPQYVPTQDQKQALKNNGALVGFLDHLCHPMSIMNYIMGKVITLYYERSANGGGFATLRFESGSTGSLHFTNGQSGTSPLERLEVVGQGANVIVENGIKLTYYRPGERGPGGYGGAPSFIGPDNQAPIVWEPEFSLGQLYNKGIFLLGYFGEVAYFADCVRENRRPEKCGLEDAIEVTRVYEAFLQPEGQVIEIKR